jgi:hypothetical protein
MVHDFYALDFAGFEERAGGTLVLISADLLKISHL